eukprot:TRINITY_DN11301_c0_g2_i1.p1 TRINITY_DN11301_c0_g2~~TRINITY_DN11301_c0_g2_i1.p1  ORF type:complete len:319 (-),score=46.68 TRINITY_DN11301_c0_g2_i1:80-1036(-)
MRPVGGGFGERALLQSSAQRGSNSGSSLHIRGDHTVFLDRASSSLAACVAESSQLLRAAGTPPRGRLKAADDRQLALGYSGGYANGAQPSTQIPRVGTARGRSARDLFATLSASSDGGVLGPPLPAPSITSLALPRSSTPPRGRRRAQPDSGPPFALETTTSQQRSSSPRVVSVKDFQRGVPVVPPAPLLPFRGPGGHSPGRRRRMAEFEASSSRSLSDPARGVPSGRDVTGAKHVEDLSDGTTAMLPAVQCKLGELTTAPVAACSSFSSLLDRLVDQPESCLSDPLALFRAPVTVAKPELSFPSSPIQGNSKFSLRA